MFMMVDQSGSMDTDEGGKTRWQHVVDALTGFVLQSPDTDGIGVAIQYFPLPLMGPDPCAMCGDINCCSACGANSITCINNVCTCSSTDNGSCEMADYQTPEVPMTVLPMASSLIISSLAMHAPLGGTPTRPALEGAMSYMQAWAAANPDHKSIIVLATDGEPTGCSTNDVSDVANIAAAGVAADPQVLTFVVGVGGGLADLNQVAQAGGTGSAFLVDSGGNVTQDFVDAMNAIRETVLACEYLIPEPKNGDMIDYDQVNVTFTPTGKMPVTIFRVANAASCDKVTGGWYYDDPVKPTKILLCDATCEMLKNDPSAQIDVVLGCATILQ